MMAGQDVNNKFLRIPTSFRLELLLKGLFIISLKHLPYIFISLHEAYTSLQ
jgi:hypothetical protein